MHHRITANHIAMKLSIVLSTSFLACALSVSLSGAPSDIRVLQLNIWQEGTMVPGGEDAIADAIAESGADIVFLEEIRNYGGRRFIPRIAGKTAGKGIRMHWHDSGSDCGILSRYPVAEDSIYSGPGSVHKCKIIMGRDTISAYSVHLDYTHYACYLPRGYDGVSWKKLGAPVTSEEEILRQNNASARIPVLSRVIEDAAKEISRGNDVIICGDFNEPSADDWTIATAGTADHNGVSVRWPCSTLLKEAGFLDTYREIHPDPVTHPGYTYPSDNESVDPGKLTWAPDADERDRIDFIWYYPGGRLTAVNAAILGPESSIARGCRQPETSSDIFIKPGKVWPSDHKGVIADFKYKSGPGPGNFGLAEIWSDGMVIQRDTRILVEGTGRKGSRIKVKLGGHSRSTKVGSDGKWSVTMPPLPAGTGYEMTLTSGKKSFTIKDIAVGEVWMCSGQSNMEFKLAGCDTASEDLKNADDSGLRLFNMLSPLTTYGVKWTEEQTRDVNAYRYYNPTKWEKSGRNSAARFSAVAWHFGKMLRDSLNVPVGLICNAVGGSTAESWIPMDAIRDSLPILEHGWDTSSLAMEWARDRAAFNMTNSRAAVKRHPFKPAYLFDVGIRPHRHFPVRGAIWYQGESNAENIPAHETMFRTLVKSWRDWWGNPEMPFLAVQLSSIERPTWPEFRDSQRKLADSIEGCSIAVSSDLGHPTDVHPRAKKPVGRRLAAIALRDVYGFDIPGHSPSPLSATMKDGKIIIRFDNAVGLTTPEGESLRGFSVQTDDGEMTDISACITGLSEVTADCPHNNVKAILYGWKPYTDANLYGNGGLPVSTFKLYVNEQ